MTIENLPEDLLLEFLWGTLNGCYAARPDGESTHYYTSNDPSLVSWNVVTCYFFALQSLAQSCKGV